MDAVDIAHGVVLEMARGHVASAAVGHADGLVGEPHIDHWLVVEGTGTTPTEGVHLFALKLVLNALSVRGVTN